MFIFEKNDIQYVSKFHKLFSGQMNLKIIVELLNNPKTLVASLIVVNH